MNVEKLVTSGVISIMPSSNFRERIVIMPSLFRDIGCSVFTRAPHRARAVWRGFFRDCRLGLKFPIDNNVVGFAYLPDKAMPEGGEFDKHWELSTRLRSNADSSLLILLNFIVFCIIWCKLYLWVGVGFCFHLMNVVLQFFYF